MRLYTGMPDPSQMPQQVMFPPPPPSVIEILGTKIPAELLHSASFWVFLLLVLGALVAVTYFKHGRAK